MATSTWGCAAAWPDAQAPRASAAAPDPGSDRALIEAQPVCIVEKTASAGKLGHTLLYRYHREGDHVVVGYFAYWSTERPWGDNALTFLGVPALAMETVYTHFLFVLPGIRQAIYGPGDIEGARVEYVVDAAGRLEPVAGRADDDHHRPVTLSRDDLEGNDGRVVLMTDVWSHQLGAKGAADFVAGAAWKADMRCFAGAELRPLSAATARALAMGNEHDPKRARPAWRLSPSGTRYAGEDGPRAAF